MLARRAAVLLKKPLYFASYIHTPSITNTLSHSGPNPLLWCCSGVKLLRHLPKLWVILIFFHVVPPLRTPEVLDAETCLSGVVNDFVEFIDVHARKLGLERGFARRLYQPRLER